MIEKSSKLLDAASRMHKQATLVKEAEKMVETWTGNLANRRESLEDAMKKVSKLAGDLFPSPDEEKPPFKAGDIIHSLMGPSRGIGFRVAHIRRLDDGVWVATSAASGREYRLDPVIHWHRGDATR